MKGIKLKFASGFASGRPTIRLVNDASLMGAHLANPQKTEMLYYEHFIPGKFLVQCNISKTSAISSRIQSLSSTRQSYLHYNIYYVKKKKILEYYTSTFPLTVAYANSMRVIQCKTRDDNNCRYTPGARTIFRETPPTVPGWLGTCFIA